MDTSVLDQAGPPETAAPPRSAIPWLNRKLIAGSALIGGVLLLTLLGRLFWNTDLALAASSPLNLPPFWADGGTSAHPLGTENSGRDMLALRSEEHTSELQSRENLVCRLLLEKKNN